MSQGGERRTFNFEFRILRFPLNFWSTCYLLKLQPAMGFSFWPAIFLLFLIFPHISHIPCGTVCNTLIYFATDKCLNSIKSVHLSGLYVIYLWSEEVVQHYSSTHKRCKNLLWNSSFFLFSLPFPHQSSKCQDFLQLEGFKSLFSSKMYSRQYLL